MIGCFESAVYVAGSFHDENTTQKELFSNEYKPFLIMHVNRAFRRIVMKKSIRYLLCLEEGSATQNVERGPYWIKKPKTNMSGAAKNQKPYISL